MTRVTRGTIEAQIANAVVQFHREHQGRGPADVRIHLIGDLVLVRCTGVLTVTESQLTATEEGRRLIKSARRELRAIAGPEEEEMIAKIVGCRVLRSYGDIDVEAAEQMEVFVLEADVEKRLLRQDLDALTGLSPNSAVDRARSRG